jgi:hypothetical protein
MMPTDDIPELVVVASGLVVVVDESDVVVVVAASVVVVVPGVVELVVDVAVDRDDDVVIVGTKYKEQLVQSLYGKNSNKWKKEICNNFRVEDFRQRHTRGRRRRS